MNAPYSLKIFKNYLSFNAPVEFSALALFTLAPVNVRISKFLPENFETFDRKITS